MKIELSKREIGAIQDVLGTIIGIMPKEVMNEENEEVLIDGCAAIEECLMEEEGIDIPEDYLIRSTKEIMNYAMDYCPEIQDIILTLEEISTQDDNGYNVIMDIVDTFKNITFKQLLAIKLKQSISNLASKITNRLKNRNIESKNKDYVVVRDINDTDEIESKKGALI